MSASDRLWFLDLVFVVGYTGLVGGAIAAGFGGTIRVLLVLPLVLFLPGYVLLAVVYPAMHDFDPEERKDTTRRTGNLLEPLPHDYMLEPVERIGLSIVFSLAIVPAVMLVANFTPYGVTASPIFVGLGLFIVTVSILALLVRWRIPAEYRYAPSIGLVGGLLFTDRSTTPRSSNDASVAIFNVVLIASVLVAGAGFGYMIMMPGGQQAAYTEFHVATDGVDGETTTWYPDTFSQGETNELPVSIVNEEGEDVEYTAVVLLQDVDADRQGVEVNEEAELQRETISVADGERVDHTLSFEPTFGGEELRLVVLLYAGDVPEDPSEENADNALDFFVRVN